MSCMNPTTMNSIILNPKRSLSNPNPISYPSSTTTTTSSDTGSESDETPSNFSNRFQIPNFRNPSHKSYKLLEILSGHQESVSCLALCGEFILSASQGKDIIVWQQPDLRLFTKFGAGDGSVKALVTVGNKVFTAHQDSRIRVWKVSRRSENVFRLVDTLPTTKDYLGKFMKQSNYVQIRRHHKKLWIEHADSISCLAVSNGLIYSGSWDKTLKVWRLSDLKCLESIRAHSDAINGLIVSENRVYSASADGKIKVWEKEGETHGLKGTLDGHKDVSLNAVIVSRSGQRMVFGAGSDGYLMGWEWKKNEGWKLMVEVKAHQMAVLCLAFMGETLCSGSADKSICLWRMERGKEGLGGLIMVGAIRGHEGPVKCLQVSPNVVGGGYLLYSGSMDKSLRVWWVPKEIAEKEQI